MAQLPQGRPCVCGVGAMAPARTQPPIPVLVQSTAPISQAAHLPMALEEQVENQNSQDWSQTALGSKPSVTGPLPVWRWSMFFRFLELLFINNNVVTLYRAFTMCQMMH